MTVDEEEGRMPPPRRVHIKVVNGDGDHTSFNAYRDIAHPHKELVYRGQSKSGYLKVEVYLRRSDFKSTQRSF